MYFRKFVFMLALEYSGRWFRIFSRWKRKTKETISSRFGNIFNKKIYFSSLKKPTRHQSPAIYPTIQTDGNAKNSAARLKNAAMLKLLNNLKNKKTRVPCFYHKMFLSTDVFNEGRLYIFWCCSHVFVWPIRKIAALNGGYSPL